MICRLLSVCSLLFCFSFFVHAQESEKLNFDTVAQEPYGMEGRGGRGVRGIFVDMLKLLSLEAGLEAKFQIFPVGRIVRRLEVGQTHCSIFRRTPITERSLYRTAQIPWELDTVVVVRSETPVSNFLQISGHSLAVPRGTEFNRMLVSKKNLKLVMTNGYSQSVRMLERGRVEAIIGTGPSLHHIMNKQNMNDGYTSFEIDRSPIFLYCNKVNVDSHMRAKLKRVAEVLINKSRWKLIIEGYENNIHRLPE